MNQDNKPAKRATELKYGKAVADYGFTIVPNDLLRNLKTLNLTPSQIVVLIMIISIGKMGGSAGLIASWANIHPDTVRSAFRALEKKGLIQRIRYAVGDVNHFLTDGLVEKTKRFGENRQRSKYIVDRGIQEIANTPMVNSHSIKDEKEIKELKEVPGGEGRGYLHAKQVAERLKKRRFKT